MNVQPQRERFERTSHPILDQGLSPAMMPVAEITAESASSTLFRRVADEPFVVAPLSPPAEQPSVDPQLQRVFDVTLAFLFILLLGPVMLVAAVLVSAGGQGPVIFRHMRIGRDGNCFECLKFRSMDERAELLLPELLDACGSLQEEWLRDQKIRCDPRITTVGRYLRRFSIDELPQLFNVLRGEMSIVGPRPIVHAEIHRYADRFQDYCAVRPGLTGLWQVSGRNDLPYERRVELDSEYARRKSLTLDCVILVRTLPVVLFGRGC